MRKVPEVPEYSILDPRLVLILKYHMTSVMILMRMLNAHAVISYQHQQLTLSKLVSKWHNGPCVTTSKY